MTLLPEDRYMLISALDALSDAVKISAKAENTAISLEPSYGHTHDLEQRVLLLQGALSIVVSTLMLATEEDRIV